MDQEREVITSMEPDAVAYLVVCRPLRVSTNEVQQ